MLVMKPLLHAVLIVIVFALVKNCSARSDSHDDSTSQLSILTNSLEAPCRIKDYRRLLYRGALTVQRYITALMSAFNGNQALMLEASVKLNTLGFPAVLTNIIFNGDNLKPALVVLENAANSPDCIKDCENSLSYSSESSDESSNESSESSGSHYSRSSRSSRSSSSESRSSYSRSHRRYESRSSRRDVHVSCPSCNSCPSMSCEACNNHRIIRTHGKCKNPSKFHLSFTTSQNSEDDSSNSS